MLPLLLLACADPFATANVSVVPEGLEVQVSLFDIDSATLAGQPVQNGQTITIPRAQLQTGYNRWPFEGGDFDEFAVAEATIGVQDALLPSCTGGGRGTLSTEGKYSYDQRFIVSDCPLVDGAIQVTVDPLPGLTLEAEGVELSGTTLRVPIGHLALDSALSTQASFGAGRVHFEVPMVVKTPAGQALEQTLKVSYKDSAVGPFFDGLPGTLQGLPAPSGDPKVAVFPSGAYFWTAGPADGLKLSQADVFIAVDSGGAPQKMKSCTFRGLGTGGDFTMPAESVAVTYVAYDRAGQELARTTLEPGGCPGNAVYEEGKTLRVVPGDGQVRAWAQSLLQ